MTQRPRILIFTGDGKGKTTAALGMAMRAAGHGMKVAIVQFIKNDATTGELAAAARLDNVRIVQTGLGFVPPATRPDFARHRAAAEAGLRLAEEILADGQAALVVLDEVCIAIARGLLAEQGVIDVVRKARPDACVVLTGRGATAGLIELADTVSDIHCVKHGLSAGRAAQRGVEM
jgi:cob(I)alamin adenosyltransferase